MSTAFKCFGNPENKNLIGYCRHQTPPEDGVWKIAPKHMKMLEDELVKYECLVSYARKPIGSHERNTHEAPTRFRKEVKELKDEHGDWQHGYIVECLQLFV